jgi:hypothetical protein
VLADVGEALLGAQRLELGEREVLGEPLVRERVAIDHLRRPPVGELRVVGDVGRRADRRLVARDQHAVLRGHEVGLDVVRAHPRGQPVGAERVLGAVARGAAMAVDRDRLSAMVAMRPGGRDWEGEQGTGGEQRRGDSARNAHGRQTITLAARRVSRS